MCSINYPPEYALAHPRIARDLVDFANGGYSTRKTLSHKALFNKIRCKIFIILIEQSHFIEIEKSRFGLDRQDFQNVMHNFTPKTRTPNQGVIMGNKPIHIALKSRCVVSIMQSMLEKEPDRIIIKDILCDYKNNIRCTQGLFSIS